MEDQWLSNLDHTCAVIVPTRNLANGLNERVSRLFYDRGQTVWLAPNIVVWSDYLRLLWQYNRAYFSDIVGAHTFISTQQSALLWTQVIEASRRSENELSLLNVRQTTRAVQRSWKLIHDWQIPLSKLSQDHVADTDQFLVWVQAYKNRLSHRGLVDEPLILEGLLANPEIRHPFAKLYLESYDLLTTSQSQYFEQAEKDGVELVVSKPKLVTHPISYFKYNDNTAEILAALQHARQCLEEDPEHSITLVVPELAKRQSLIRNLARDVFYPSKSPLEVQQLDSVYEFSLGKALSELPAITAAINTLALLNNRSSTVDFGSLLRSRFLGVLVDHGDQARLFERWLKSQRIHTFTFDQLPALYQQSIEYYEQREQTLGESLLECFQALVERRQALMQKLEDKKQTTGFSALGFTDWVAVFSDWLSAWQWQVCVHGASLDSEQYQLEKRWTRVLEDFAGFALVQKQVGLRRALELLVQMTRDTVFVAKGAASPILISGLFEAIGREVDTCIITGMNQDYPLPAANDVFVPKRFLIDSGHPQATAESGFVYAQSLMNNLLNCARRAVVSFAVIDDQNAEILMGPSALFRDANWLNGSVVAVQNKSGVSEVLESYADSHGPHCKQPGLAKGGTKIFEDQSNCAFKAFATHRLGFIDDLETEFGLDSLDRGNVVHQLLDRLWESIQSKTELDLLDGQQRLGLVKTVINDCFEYHQFSLSAEKLRLLEHESKRLQTLLLNWLEFEAQRPQDFTVIEREERRDGEVGGIRYHYVIDRLDLIDDGRTVIIDYKTGTVNRNDWKGERVKSPQMPLYALALDKIKNRPVSGIAFAQLRAGDLKFLELSEEDIFRKPSHYSKKYQQDWVENRAIWPVTFEQLANEFLAGNAQVDPIDDATCQYCKLGSLCRISQLRRGETDNTKTASNEGLS